MNNVNHHGEFTLHAFLYVTRLIAEQRYDEVLQLGLRRDQVEAIRHMTTKDIHEVSSAIRGNFLTVHLHPDALDAAILVLKRRKKDEDLDEALMLAGARFEMMRDLCGMSSEEYAKLRRYLNVAESRGRPPVPSDEVQVDIWKAWRAAADEPDIKRRCLAVHEVTQVPAGTIWRLVQEWERADRAFKSPKATPVDSDLETSVKIE